jgi:RecA-family ATPase
MTLPHEIPQQDGKLNEFIPPEFRGGIFARFAMKKMADLKAILPTQWLDSTAHGMIPRGNAMLLVTASSKGKSTSLFHACAKAAATGTWSMFGTRAHDKPLKVVYVSAEDNEQTITRKAAYDGRRDAYDQTQI